MKFDKTNSESFPSYLHRKLDVVCNAYLPEFIHQNMKNKASKKIFFKIFYRNDFAILASFC